METPTICNNAGTPWSQEEDHKLNKLYNEDTLDILEISTIHNREPGGIISRLVLNKHITNRTLARGYLIYKNSDLYKQAKSNNIQKKIQQQTDALTNPEKNKTKQIDNLLISINKNDYIELQNELKEIKLEIKGLKNTINELVEMMKSVYEFEDA